MKATKDLLNLVDTTALVTGASGTIGYAISTRLLEAGARVALHYNNNANALEPLLVDYPEHTCLVQANFCEPGAVEVLFENLTAQSFVPNALINNAADQSVAALDDLSVTDWQHMLSTNLESIFLLSQHAIQHMQSGSIVNISSIESFDPALGHGHYATSKAGLNMLTRSQALEFGGKQIRVNAISPGLIRRQGIEEAWPEGVARWQERAPLGRMGEGFDVADAVLFLVSDAARWISGANLVVDGGMTAQSKW